MHRRTAIRAAVAARLQAHLAVVGLTDCYAGRVQPTREDRMPFARVLLGDESSELLTDSGDEKRALSVSIRVYERAEEDLGAALDAIAEKIEGLFWHGGFLGDLAGEWRHTGSDLEDGEGDSVAARHEAGTLTLNYECTYRWSPPDTTADLAPFAHAHVTTQAASASGVARAEDHIELPQD
ncbi:hypothetical protein AZ34_11875 [Hylemonella gracilis str. Niagara R]|uniref:Uncharacterized protein n=1 Tax=Hylemonella gracilis str. Niagara R TaxID=1458275 RepID=A0A016XM23_9BURK|nr:hypothetical protein [Hylemonella gracilis]EYC52891.1 hypothetical protein AZ34_11875 [Hylemonella gracilis str. Niagara R]